MKIKLYAFLMLVLAVSYGAFANEKAIKLSGLQKELEELKRKAERHTGTVLAESNVKVTTEYLPDGWPPTSVARQVSKLVTELTIIKVETGPMELKPGTKAIGPTSELGPGAAGKKEKRRFKYYLTIRNGHLQYEFVPLDKRKPNKSTDQKTDH